MTAGDARKPAPAQVGGTEGRVADRTRGLLLAALAVVAAGCFSGTYPGSLKSRGGCGSLAGVFFNQGRNDLGAEEVYHPDQQTAFLLEILASPRSMRQDMRRGRDLSVAMRQVGGAGVRFAVLDRDGAVLETGVYSWFDTCRRGVLLRDWDMGDGVLTMGKRCKHTLRVNPRGKLVFSRQCKSYDGLAGVLPVVRRQRWEEYEPDPRFDLDAIDLVRSGR